MPRAPRKRNPLRVLWPIILLVAAGGIVWVLCRTPSPPDRGVAPSDDVFSLEGKQRPDAVFLVVVDTLRADRLSCYGYETHATPNIDRLADFGLRFTRAQTVASWTRPSMGSMLTSLYPRQLGLLERPVPGRRFAWREKRGQLSVRIPPHAQTAAEAFHAAGFRTAAFVNQPALNASSTFARGFLDYYYPLTQDEIRLFCPGKRDHRLQDWKTLTHADISDGMLVRQCARWLEQHGKQRLFVWLHMLTPHVPYQPPAEFAPPAPEGGGKPAPSDLYDGEVRAVDAMIGELVAAIEQHVGLERSLIVFTSDHGEEFGDHGYFGHGHSLHQEVTRVPLILASPRILPARVIDEDVRILDIVPTIIDFAGLSGAATAAFEGVSLTSSVVGRTPDLPVYCEGMLYGNTQRCLTDDGFKLLFDEAESNVRLFDVQTDPLEREDLVSTKPQRVAVMMDRLNEMRSRLQQDFIAGIRRRPDRTSADELEQERQRTREALRSLGYVGDD